MTVLPACALPGWTTQQVVDSIVVPASKPCRGAFLDIPGVVHARFVGPASVVVAHSWQGSFHALVRTLQVRDTRVVWLRLRGGSVTDSGAMQHASRLLQKKRRATVLCLLFPLASTAGTAIEPNVAALCRRHMPPAQATPSTTTGWTRLQPRSMPTWSLTRPLRVR